MKDSLIRKSTLNLRKSEQLPTMKTKHIWHFLTRLLIGPNQPRWVWILLGALVLTAYVLTLSPGALGGDPGELQFVPAILSIPHPTGTPLYMILGKIWSMLPLGASVAWRMNLLAAVSAALTAVMVYQIVYLLSNRVIPSLSAALSLALGLTFWEQAVLADKYAFNALLVSLVIYLALRWGKTRSPTTLYLLAFVYGLSLAHHRTMALFAPTLLGYIWWHEKSALWQNRRRLLILIALFLIPLSLYFYLPWAESRNLPPGTWRPRTLSQWYAYLFDTGRTGLVYVDFKDLGQMLLFYAHTLQRDFTWVGVLLGVGGLAWQFHRRPADAVFLTFNYVVQAFLAANHHVPRQWVYFIPSFLIFSLWIGEAIGGIAGWLESRKAAPLSVLKYLALVLNLGLLFCLLWPVPARYRTLRLSSLGYGTLDAWRQTLKTGHLADRIGQAIAHVEPDAVILCDWEQSTPLWYYQQVEGLRSGVQIVYPIERLDEMAVAGRPLYLARTLPGVAPRWRPSAAGPLIALHDEPSFSLPTDMTSLNISFGPGGELDRRGAYLIELAGFATGSSSLFHPAQVVPLTLYWRALASPGYDYSVSLRLFNGAGEQVFQVDSQHPVLGMYPTSLWQPGEVVADYYEIQLAPDLPSGVYQWRVILYRALPEGGWESLRVNGADVEMGSGGSFEVLKR